MSRHKKKSSQPKNWYRLDNAAKIYPVLMRSRHGGYFRLAVLLHEPVDPVILQQALEATLKRFPFFAVRLRRGLFWYYLESYDGIPKIEPDVQNPMRPWTRKEIKKFLFRVRYDQKRISVEFFHALTDGSGGMVFLKTLAAAYLRLRGDFCGIGAGALDINRPADSDEMEDAYKRYSNFRVVHRPRETKAFHLQGTIMPGHWLQIISGVLPLDRVKSVARSYGISVTEFLAGVYLYQLYRIQQQGGYNTLAPVRLSIPIDVRRFYPSKTLRNFSLYANPGILPAFGTYTLEEILGLVHHFMRYTVNEKYLNALMCANVGPERSILLRLAPLPLKNMVMRLVYHFVGESRFTSSLSNLGAVDMPVGMAEAVERFEFLLGPSHYNLVNCAVVSTGNQLLVSFSSTMIETAPQRAFFKELVRMGIPVRVESNTLYPEVD